MTIINTGNQNVTLHHGNSLDVIKTLPDCSVDSLVTDPPYEIGFMSKGWDNTGIAYNVELWAECLRVLKPGGHLLSFGSTRTYHRMACAIEDAGFVIRDSIHWTYGSGFPKSLDVSKAIDKGEGHWRGKAGEVESGNGAMAGPNYERTPKGDPITPAAQQWDGWGTALKPSHEPIVVARKPLMGTVAANVLTHGTGALNIDATRVGSEVRLNPPNGAASGSMDTSPSLGTGWGYKDYERVSGRFPANTILGHAADCVRVGEREDERAQHGRTQNFGGGAGGYVAGEAADTPKKQSTTNVYECVQGCPVLALDEQSDNSSRFFQNIEWDEATDDLDNLVYISKAPKRERPVVDGVAHATVKPLALMRYLIRLVTPPGGTVLEPFTGSGTTVEACLQEGMKCIAIELEETHIPLIQARIDRVPVIPNAA